MKIKKLKNLLNLIPKVPGANFYAPWGPRGPRDLAEQFVGFLGPSGLLISFFHVQTIGIFKLSINLDFVRLLAPRGLLTLWALEVGLGDDGVGLS